MIMKKSLAFITIAILAIVSIKAQTSNWKVYTAYHNANSCVAVGSSVFTVCDGSLFSYNTSDTELLAYSKATGLSDQGIEYMAYSKSQGKILLIYSNQNIDIIEGESNVYNLPQYKNSSVSDKTINDVNIVGKYAYLATNTGIVVVDMERMEFANTYTLGVKVNSCTASSGYIYAATSQGIYRGKLTDNLLDASAWSKKSDDLFTRIIYFDSKIYGISNTLGFCILESESLSPTIINQEVYKYIDTDGTRMFVGSNSKIHVYTLGSSAPSVVGVDSYIENICYQNNLYYACCGSKGLQAYKMANNALTAEGSPIVPNSPIRNYGAYLSMTDYDRLLIAGGSHNYTGINYEGTLMQLEKGTWTNFDESGIETATNVPFLNATSIVEDKGNTAHHFASTAGTGLYEFNNFKYSAHYDCDNSPLKTILPNSASKKQYVRINGLTYDSDGNLWMLNNEVDTVLCIKTKSNGWKKIYINELDGNPTMDKILLDSRGWAWINSRRTASSKFNAGILCLDFGGTIDDTSDDRTSFRTTFINQDNTSYTFNLVNDMTEDKSGQIWVATDKGPFVIATPSNFFNTNFTFTQIKIPRNDGTNYADYLLNGTQITAIAIDGANRKWLTTDVSGVYLVSADGQETIHHFTAENSPLLSNSVYSIAVSHSTGEVFFGTSKGLCSFISDAIDAESELNEDNIKVYPNPVRPEYNGNIHISGLTDECDVKITSTSGQLVASGVSSGGIFTWNGCDKSGKKVASGVYYVLASTSDGSEGATARIVIIR